MMHKITESLEISMLMFVQEAKETMKGYAILHEDIGAGGRLP